ncbi:7 transmembrane receptor (rhodopsin family) domain-containing protein [Ditylenchus destructor]|uniref:7 transmembrane receptor (Rhodopsin family) domain-containing protein n=1 Tax=Ditylenchus destructor TaxID=166010 RepID=A0AAD4MQE7_9BILA|nr:7 transmembrane receptor (rhodopsin family) domain-containing protein [Ditylenchus destructor]
MTSPEFDIVYFLYLIISITVFFTVLFVGINANVVVLIAILGDKKMRKSATSLLLLNLAVADLLYLIVVLLWIAFTPDLRAVLCPSYKWIHNSLLLGSVETYTAISLERYIALVHPMKVKHLCCRRNVLISMFLIWITAFLLESPTVLEDRYMAKDHFPYFQSLWQTDMRNQSSCSNIYFGTKKMKWFWYAELLFTYFLPFLVSSLLYFKICRELWSSNPRVLHRRARCSEEEGIRNSTDASIKSALRSRKSVIKMLIICMVMFFICYTPMTILFFLVGVLDWHVLYVELSMSFAMLVMVPSAANPFLYALFSSTFRLRVRAVMPRLFDICCNCFSTMVKKIDSSKIRDAELAPNIDHRVSA